MLLPPLISTPRTGGLPAGQVSRAAWAWVGEMPPLAFGSEPRPGPPLAAPAPLPFKELPGPLPRPMSVPPPAAAKPGLSPPEGDMASEPVPPVGRQSNFGAGLARNYRARVRSAAAVGGGSESSAHIEGSAESSAFAARARSFDAGAPAD